MEQNDTTEAIQLLNSQVERLQDRITHLEDLISVMFILLKTNTGKEYRYRKKYNEQFIFQFTLSKYYYNETDRKISLPIN